MGWCVMGWRSKIIHEVTTMERKKWPAVLRGRSTLYYVPGGCGSSWEFRFQDAQIHSRYG